MIIRGMDIVLATAGLLIASPILLPIMILLWIQDRHSPFYIAPRVGKQEVMFRMIKLRSMRHNADASGVDSTANRDPRITQLGRFIRRYKLDEIPQLWNVLRGDMSLVGPRPNVKRETDLYTPEEKRLLSVRPGITDYASIVFSDEGEILDGKEDPDLAYNQLIRPWKSRLGIFYIEHKSAVKNIYIVFLTLVAILSRAKALEAVARNLQRLRAPDDLVRISYRKDALVPHSPPGTDEIVTSRFVA